MTYLLIGALALAVICWTIAGMVSELGRRVEYLEAMALKGDGE